MGKKSLAKRKKVSVRKKKTVWHYIRVVFMASVVGIAVFSVGSYFFKPSMPCANSATCSTDLTMQINNSAIGLFEGKKVIPPKIITISNPNVLGTSTGSGQKHVYVDLSTQTLYAYQGAKLFLKTLISSGRWGPTPVGNFHIWEKLRSTRMAGGEGADAYDLPNVPFVMYFYHDWGLHGAYWHNNFGHTMSHGCVNMRIVDAQTLYNWTDGPTDTQQGTPVSICDSFKISSKTCVQQDPIED